MASTSDDPTALDLASLAGTVAVFSGTGNTTGLGFAVAVRCAALGMHICLSDRNDDTDAMRSAVATLRAQVRE